MDDEAAHVGGLEQQVGAEGDGVAAEGDRAAFGSAAADEVPGFVEFSIIRQMDLRHDAEDLAAMDGDGAVIKCTQMP